MSIRTLVGARRVLWAFSWGLAGGLVADGAAARANVVAITSRTVEQTSTPALATTSAPGATPEATPPQAAAAPATGNAQAPTASSPAGENATTWAKASNLPPRDATEGASQSAQLNASNAQAPSAVPSHPIASETVTLDVSATEGIQAKSADGAFSLKLGTIIQTRFSASSTPDPSRKVEFVPVLARLYAQGTLGAPWLKFYLQPEFAGQQSPEPVVPVPPAPRLLDAWVEVQPAEWFGLRLGIMRPLFSRSWINGLQRALMFDRSDANLFFRTHGPILEVSGSNVEPTLAWDRDIGVSLAGAPLDGVLEYSFGLFNGNGSWFGRNGDQWVMPMARLAVNPLGLVAYDETLAATDADADWKFQLAVGAYQNRYRVDYVNPGLESDGSEEQRTLGADVTMAGSGVYLSAEGYLRSRRLTSGETSEERGATALVGWMFWAPYLEAAARLSYIDPNRDAKSDLRHAYEAQLNYYQFGNNLKLGLRYAWSKNQAPSIGGVPGALTMLAPGVSVSAVSLLTQLYF